MIINETGLAYFNTVYNTPAGWKATFCVKGSFVMEPTGLLQPEEDVQASGDQYADRDNALPVYDSDLALFKPRGEVMLIGRCFAPENKPVRGTTITLQMGPISKTIVAIGDREWIKTSFGAMEMSAPQPFQAMDVSYANAYGGPGFKANPCGKGYYAKRGNAPSSPYLLPNIENPASLIQSFSDQPEPSGFGPLNRVWPKRMEKTGSYDDKWMKDRWPWFPDDFNYAYFNAAPEDQQVKGFFNGDEAFRLGNLHPQVPVIEGKLPGTRVRCFIHRRGNPDSALEELAMNLDTIWIYPEEMRFFLIWRGNAPVSGEEMADVENVLIASENLNESPRALMFYQEGFIAAREQEKAAFDMDADEGPELSEEESREALLALLTPYEKEQYLTAEAKQAELEDKFRVALAAEGIDYDQLKANAIKEEPPSDDPDDIIKWAEAKERDIKERITKELEAEGIVVDMDAGGSSGHTPHMTPSVALEDIRKNLISGGIDDPEILKSIDGLSASLSDLNFEFESLIPMERGTAIAALAAGKALKGRDMTGFDLSGQALSGAVLDEATLERADLRGVDFSRASLVDVDFTNADLGGANLSGAVMSGALLVNANLSGSDLSGADLRAADLSGADLSGADFSGADISEADFSDAMLDDAVFKEVKGLSATFSGAKGIGVDFSGADLSGSRADEETALPDAVFESAVLTESCWSGADLCGGVFVGSCLDAADFSGCRLLEADFHGASLKEANLAKADLARANMTRVNMFRGNLEKAKLSGTDLSGSNFYEVEFWEADLQGANLSGAYIKMTKLA